MTLSIAWCVRFAGFACSASIISACGGGAAAENGGPATAGAANGGTAMFGGSGSVAGPGGGAASGSGGNASVAGGNVGTTGGAELGGTAGAGGATAGGAGADAGGGAGAATGGAGGAFGVCSGSPKQAVTVYMIGDSTMSIYASDLYPRTGWGQPLGASFAPACATVVDKALSGRSSKSFFDEGAWTPVKDSLKSGDYVLIQFGHNDEKSDDPLRFTDPQTTYKQYLTTYITDARAKMATPLLLTSINRNTWSGATVSNSHGLYPAAVRELAASLKVELIDLTALTKAYFEKIGQVETTKLFLILTAGQFPNYPDGVTDNTHLQETGALTIGQLAMADAYAQRLTLASFLKAVPVAP